MEEKKWCVYIHTSPSNKAYIGITGRKPEERWGKHLSDEQKEALRKANLGKKQSEETIQKKREIMTGDVLENMKKNQPNRIEIMCIETGQIFISMAEASRQLNIDMSSIRRSLNGEYKYKTPKYNFIRVDKEET